MADPAGFAPQPPEGSLVQAGGGRLLREAVAPWLGGTPCAARGARFGFEPAFFKKKKKIMF